MKALIEFQALKKVGFLLLPYRGESSFVFVLEADLAGGDFSRNSITLYHLSDSSKYLLSLL